MIKQVLHILAITNLILQARSPWIFEHGRLADSRKHGSEGLFRSQAMKIVVLIERVFKDQNMALRWVQRNIEGFGGDKSKVTIMGVSLINLIGTLKTCIDMY